MLCLVLRGTPLILHKKVILLVMGSTTYSPSALEEHFKVQKYNPDNVIVMSFGLFWLCSTPYTIDRNLTN